MKKPNLFMMFFTILLISYSSAQPYEIPRSVFGSGGGMTGSNNYQIIGTVGQAVIGEMSGASHINQVGFWYKGNFNPCTPGFLGDINSDDAVNSTDALITLSFDAGLPIPQPILDRINIGFGDVNEEGITNSTDALIILSYDAGIPVPFPVGDPVCLPNGSSRFQKMEKTIPKEGETIRMSALPPSNKILWGMTLNVPMTIEMSNASELLGSYTAKLEWNPQMFELIKYSGGSTEGFENPIVNATETENGKLKFAHAYPFGADGDVNILNVQLKVIGEKSSSSSISLDFSAMAAARTFVDLLPYLQNEGMVMNLEIEEVPNAYTVENYPNPFNPATHIRFGIPEPSRVKIEIFNILGQRVSTLLDAFKTAGYHEIDFDASNLASGIYVYNIQAGEFHNVKKMILIK